MNLIRGTGAETGLAGEGTPLGSPLAAGLGGLTVPTDDSGVVTTRGEGTEVGTIGTGGTEVQVTPRSGFRLETRNLNGFIILVEVNDETGEEIFVQNLGQAQQPDVRGQQDIFDRLSRAEQQNALFRQFSQQQSANARIVGAFGGVTQGERIRIQREAFERAREAILGTLAGPSNFIQRFQAENATNPFELAPGQENELDIFDAQQQLASAQSIVEGETTFAEAPELAQGSESNPLLAAIDVAIQHGAEDAASLSRLSTENILSPLGTAAASIASGLQSNIDKWIKQRGTFVESPAQPAPVLRTPGSIASLQTGVSAGDPLNLSQALETPGGQQFARLSPTGAQQIGSFAKATGGRTLADLIHQFDIQRPEDPTLGRRTTAARQRA